MRTIGWESKYYGSDANAVYGALYGISRGLGNSLPTIWKKGGPLAQSALILSGVSISAPLVGYMAFDLYPAAMTFAGTYEGQELSIGAVDYFNSSLTGVPAMNIFGAAGYVAGELNKSLFGNESYGQ